MSETIDSEKTGNTGYKEVMLGPKAVKIPVSWSVEKIVSPNITNKIKAGGTPKATNEEYYGGDIKYVKIEDMSAAGKYIQSTKNYLTKEGLESTSTWLVPENSLLLSMYGSYGKVAITCDEMATNQAILGIIPSNSIDLDYLYYASSRLKPYFESVVLETTQANLNKGIVENTPILIPPLLEQRRIADILSTVDEYIQQTKELIEETKNLKRGITQDLMSKGINHNSFEKRRMGPIEAKIPSDWDIVPLSEICTEVRNGFVGSATQYYTDGEEGVPYLQSNNVRRNKMDTDEVVKISEEFNKENPQTRVYTGDLLTVQSGHIGETCVVNNQFDGANSHAIIISRVNSEVAHPEFVSHFINSEVGRRGINAIAVGSTVKHINVTDFRKFELPLPDLEEQRKIGDILNKVTDKINNERRRENKVNELKRGLMQDLLTGKARVNTD